MDWNFIVNPKELPREPGCYVIFAGCRALYAGKAVNLRARFVLHQLDVGRVNGRDIQIKGRLSIAYARIPREQLVPVEQQIIRQFTPFMNCVHNPKRVPKWKRMDW